MRKKLFIGTWKLISAESRRSNGEIIYPFGRDVVGMLMYDTHRNMSAQLMNSSRPSFAFNSQFMGSPSEIKSAFEGFLGYFGTYTIKEDKSIVIHHIEGSSFPNWVGTDQIRYYEFRKDTLLLRTDPLPARGELITGFMTWKRTQ